MSYTLGMTAAERRLVRQGSKDNGIWYCTACDWAEPSIPGKPGNLSDKETCAAFEKHVCGERRQKPANTSTENSRS